MPQYRAIIHEPITYEFEAGNRDDAWEVLQLWLDNQIELTESEE